MNKPSEENFTCGTCRWFKKDTGDYVIKASDGGCRGLCFIAYPAKFFTVNENCFCPNHDFKRPGETVLIDVGFNSTVDSA